ncbi:spermidine synthase [Legionella waltersii]|uniref:Spermidine synthase n=1 Tax=Legionella waltersii TaxID=66969 RepID=A0A0W1A097_9GAMM|nr:fused MFS/spermidine synthase [Legionella waltersii]KTD74763.1 spermidine synthase [Legionella waltersii]SNV00318.1 spermidine synthase [Legionella waltersii]
MFLRKLFPIGLFLSAVLLFSIQPMVARVILPAYGGTPAVWTVCVLFFQLILLLSYGYVWLLSQIRSAKVWRLLHVLVAVFSLTALPLFYQPGIMNEQPEWAILSSLLLQLGLPLLVIGASAPLLQFAYSLTQDKQASDPYYLYISSNLGSLLALLLYPWVIERFIPIKNQMFLWSMGYVLYLLLLTLVLFCNSFKQEESSVHLQETFPWREVVYWVLLSFIPCSLMLGVTLYISTDIAATPLFWVVPLSLYLLSFVFTFTQKPLIPQRWIIRNCLIFLVFILLGFIMGIATIPARIIIVFNLAGFFILALLCHGLLYERRPQTQRLTLFYFCLAVGGALAGIFNGIIAPRVFNNVYEYPLAILLVLLVIPLPNSRKGGWVPFAVVGLIVVDYFLLITCGWEQSNLIYQLILVCALGIIMIWHHNRIHLVVSILILFAYLYSPLFGNKNILLQERNFFGVKQVLIRDDVHVLISNSTVHGLQQVGQTMKGASSYYGPIKTVVSAVKEQFNPVTATIVGLGVGTLICQFSHLDTLKIVEIDQQMISLAKNPELFSYMRDCPAKKEVIKDDGRLALEKFPARSQQIIIVDAFNSDAVPVHLMTLEAFSIYKEKLADSGVILINLSNRHLQLLPVISAIGRSLDMMVLHLLYKGEPKLGQFDSEWALLTSNQPLALNLMRGAGWSFVADDKQMLWTDDYSNIVPLFR